MARTDPAAGREAIGCACREEEPITAVHSAFTETKITFVARTCLSMARLFHRPCVRHHVVCTSQLHKLRRNEHATPAACSANQGREGTQATDVRRRKACRIRFSPDRSQRTLGLKRRRRNASSVHCLKAQTSDDRATTQRVTPPV